jgi:hypothetical protein
MFLACQQSKVTIKLNFYYINLKKCRGNCQNCRRQVFIDRYKIAVQWRRVRGGGGACPRLLLRPVGKLSMLLEIVKVVDVWGGGKDFIYLVFLICSFLLAFYWCK